MSIASTDTSTQQLFILSRTRAGGLVGTITVGAAISEAINLDNTTTDHPVEEGADITDHVRPEPVRISADCWISNSPTDTSEQQTASMNSFAPVTSANGIGEVPGYALSVYATLVDLRNSGSLLTVISSKGIFSSMVITNLSLPCTADNFNGIQFSASFKQIIVAQNKLTRTVVSTDKRNGKRVNKGNTTPKAPAPATQAQVNRSVFRSIHRAIQ